MRDGEHAAVLDADDTESKRDQQVVIIGLPTPNH